MEVGSFPLVVLRMMMMMAEKVVSPAEMTVGLIDPENKHHPETLFMYK